MIDITTLHIHWRDHNGKAHVKAIEPTDATNPLMMKKQVAEFITKIKTSVEYYYVVVEIDRGGKPAYRTIIPKTFPK